MTTTAVVLAASVFAPLLPEIPPPVPVGTLAASAPPVVVVVVLCGAVGELSDWEAELVDWEAVLRLLPLLDAVPLETLEISAVGEPLEREVGDVVLTGIAGIA